MPAVSRIWEIKAESMRRLAMAAAVYRPCFRAFRLPFGAPGLAPPCMRHLPFGMAGDWQDIPERVRAQQRGLNRRRVVSMGLILYFQCAPPPGWAPLNCPNAACPP